MQKAGYDSPLLEFFPECLPAAGLLPDVHATPQVFGRKGARVGVFWQVVGKTGLAEIK
jgi:hypothetical protein